MYIRNKYNDITMIFFTTQRMGKNHDQVSQDIKIQTLFDFVDHPRFERTNFFFYLFNPTFFSLAQN